MTTSRTALEGLVARWRSDAARHRKSAGRCQRRGSLTEADVNFAFAQDADAYADELEAALATTLAAREDFVLVPREPTEAMLLAWFNHGAQDGRTLKVDDELREAGRADWAAMLKAAAPPAQGTGEGA